MIEVITNILERSKVLVAKGRVEIFIADEDRGFSWRALSKPRPGVWRGIHVAILTDDPLENLEEEHQAYTKHGYLFTSRLETDRTTFLNIQDGMTQRDPVRIRACLTHDGRAQKVEIIRPIRRNR